MRFKSLLVGVWMASVFSLGVLLASPENGPVYRIPDGELIPESVSLAKGAEDWAASKLDLASAHAIAKGKGVKVAILDTGCDLNHPIVKGKVVAARDFSNSPNGASDVQGHGTWCATRVLITAPEAEVIVGKVLGDQGWGSDSWIASGVDWAADSGADVISMSLGSSSPSANIRGAIQRATAKGVIVVAAAGNEGPREGTVGFPGGFPEAICVASVGQSLQVSRFSSRGPRVDIAAPGESVVAGLPGGKYGPMSGTSMATPQVAGVAALGVSRMREVGKRLDNEACRNAMLTTANDLPPPGRDTASGAGFLRPTAFLQSLDATKPDKPNQPIKIEFAKGDFTAAGWEKLLQLNPKIDGFTFTIKP
jgi:subtilisin